MTPIRAAAIAYAFRDPTSGFTRRTVAIGQTPPAWISLVQHSRHPHATYRIVLSGGFWMVLCDDSFVAAFAARLLAELLPLRMVEVQCAEGRASQILIGDELGCEKRLCRCFEGPPPGTHLS